MIRHIKSFKRPTRAFYSLIVKNIQRQVDTEVLFLTIFFIRGRDSAVGIETSYGLDDRGVGVQVPVGSRIFSTSVGIVRLLTKTTEFVFVFVQTGSGAHPASYPMGTGDSFPGGKVAGA
jgi:hypothetical protein